MRTKRGGVASCVDLQRNSIYTRSYMSKKAEILTVNFGYFSMVQHVGETLITHNPEGIPFVLSAYEFSI